MAELDIQKCLTDFKYYCETLLKIKSKGEIVPFIFNEPQARIHQIIEDRKKENKLQRYIILKARHEGVSTYFEARNFHNAHFYENTRNLIMAHEKGSAEEIFRMCRLFYDCLPVELQPMTKYFSKNEILFANPKPKTKHDNPGLRSSIRVLTAGTDSIGRGSSFDAGSIHFSEVAFWPYPEEIIDSVLSVVPMTPDVMVVYESTANGIGNYFYEEWVAAQSDKSNFFPIFLPWYELSSYQYPFADDLSKEEFLRHLTKDEIELQERHTITPEQLLWRRMKIKDYRLTKLNTSPLEKFKQEFPSSPEEAFIVSGVCTFDREKLKSLTPLCKIPNHIGEITVDGFHETPKGELSIWESAIKDAKYFIGVDASGGVGQDYGCACVLKMLKPPLVAQQVAEYHGQCDPLEFAQILTSLGNWYNEALVAIEVFPSAHGATVQTALLKSYYNLYRGESLTSINCQLQNKFGWETNVRTKPLLISLAKHCIGVVDEPAYISINSKELISECMTYVRDGTAGNAQTGHDDRVIAFMIALYALHKELEYTDFSSLAMVENAPKPDIKSLPPIDFEWLQILNSPEVGNNTKSWLDY